MQGLIHNKHPGRVPWVEWVQRHPLPGTAQGRHKRKKNAMARHLNTFHPDREGDPDSFMYSSVATFKERLDWQISEGVAMMRSNAEVSEDRQHRILMNLKNEYRSLQPAVHGTSVTRQTRNGSKSELSLKNFKKPQRISFLISFL